MLWTQLQDEDILEGKYTFLDNDILNILSSDTDFFEETTSFFASTPFVISPTVKVEFLRDIYVPEKLAPMEKFINNEEIFLPAANPQDIYSKVFDNSLILSRIYSHNSNKLPSSHSPGSVDLFLAARVMLYSENALLITGNRSDFPQIIFDVEGVMNYEKEGGVMQPFYILSFNSKKFDSCMQNLNKIGT